MLHPAQFYRLDKKFKTVGAPVKVQFNPNEFTMTKAAQIAEVIIPGLDAPLLQFVRGQTETMSLELFFDSTEGGTDETAKAVTEDTDKFYQLIKIDRTTHAIPVCRFEWGTSSFPGSKLTEQWASQNASRVNGFNCIVDNVRQRFTMFSPLGVPLRATLTVQLREYKSLTQQIEQIRFESPDHTHTHQVQRGETLSFIAGKVYDDPRQWRAIANHNQLDDPLEIPVGAVLEIPPIQ
jgi:Uncharacterized protein containing LysM domain